MPKKRLPSLNYELAEYLKFLHLHNLVDIISIIESIPIYYQTQIKKFNNHDFYFPMEKVNMEKNRLQNLTYIAQKLYDFELPNFRIDFQTVRFGPFSLDIENELQNLIYSDVFNNAISSKKTFYKRYKITEYDKDFIVICFSGLDNYRNFLNLVSDRDIFFLRDISLLTDFHNYYNDCNSRIYRFYIANDRNKYKILSNSLKDLTCRKNKNQYILNLIDLFFILLRVQSLQNQAS